MNRPTSRRSVLAATGAAVASAGCVGRVRNIAGRDGSSQLVLEINTTPADDDPNAVRIARHLSENLTAVGVDARVNTMTAADLRRSVLLNHDFDVYVGQFPEAKPFDPDALYALTHSSFTAETGWQNPFGFTELAVDDLLDEQRIASDDRRPTVVDELQEAICDQQPFSVIAFPDALTAIGDGEFVGWGSAQPTSARGLLQLEHVGASDADGEGEEPTTLRLMTTDTRITENWNPIAAEYRRHGTFTSLLYDALVLPNDEEPIPWLAREWEWIDPDTIRVTLRDTTWHDGEPLTASDVAFTYTFLTDTSMGNAETPIPTPKYRGRSSIVAETSVIDESTIDLTVGTVNRTVGERAMQVPILPEHVWSELTDTVAIAGIEIDEGATEALVWNNEEPVGSGPLRFVEATPEAELTLERNPDHFLHRIGPEADTDDLAIDDGDDSLQDDGDGSLQDDGDGSDSDTGDAESDPESDYTDGIPDEYVGKPSFDRLVLEVAPSDIAAVQSVGDGRADATASNLGPDSVPRIGREADARLVSTRSAAFYHVGYNNRRAPLSNPRFRGILASLIDKPTLVDDAFDGYATPATSPLAASSEWVPESLRFDGDTEADPVYPFYGENGELDVAAARDALRAAGYRFNEAGELLARDQ
ncbi:ABC transporter substrate-binding protein [Halorubrum sp. DTA98]|uniref:ABC transporter substrate-binding protein n=1 Tax=Halorubrum sp. DTA98 TaxID=3402163 RepID=UPI003AAD1473